MLAAICRRLRCSVVTVRISAIKIAPHAVVLEEQGAQDHSRGSNLARGHCAYAEVFWCPLPLI